MNLKKNKEKLIKFNLIKNNRCKLIINLKYNKKN